MIKYFETSIEDDDEWIECPSDYEFEPGERVKMK